MRPSRALLNLQVKAALFLRLYMQLDRTACHMLMIDVQRISDLCR